MSSRVNLDDIEARMNKLESAADLDGDGFVTRAELERYTSRELELRDSEILLLRNEKIRLEKDIDCALDENKRLQKAYDELYKRHETFVETVTVGENTSQTVSNAAIEKFVDELLVDPNINIYMLPDSIEKPLYMNTLKIFLGIIQKMFNNTSLDIIGHQVTMNLEPIKSD